MILGLDPGPTQSALVLYDASVGICHAFTRPNHDLRMYLHVYDAAADDVLVIEQIASMGMAVGQEVFETCFESGRFVGAWRRNWDRLRRVAIKTHICGVARAKDANVRQALIDRFGGRACIKKGGALYGVKGDEWSALAVAVTYYDLHIAAPKAVDVLALESNREGR